MIAFRIGAVLFALHALSIVGQGGTFNPGDTSVRLVWFLVYGALALGCAVAAAETRRFH